MERRRNEAEAGMADREVIDIEVEPSRKLRCRTV
jgi:hypothetical protein